MALRLFLLRHGQTALSRANMFCGRRLDPTLTAEGLAARFAQDTALHWEEWARGLDLPVVALRTSLSTEK